MAHRESPLGRIIRRGKDFAAAVDSTMMKRMPADFQRIHKKPKNPVDPKKMADAMINPEGKTLDELSGMKKKKESK